MKKIFKKYSKDRSVKFYILIVSLLVFPLIIFSTVKLQSSLAQKSNVSNPDFYSPVSQAPFSQGLVIPASCESAYEHTIGECGFIGPACSLSFNPVITEGATSSYVWSFSNNTTNFISNCTGDLGATSGIVPSPVPYVGSVTVYPTSSQVCTVQVFDAIGSSGTCSASINVGSVGTPTCSASFSPSTVNSGQTSKVTWSQTGDVDGIMPYSCTGNLGSAANTPSSPFTTGPITDTQTCTMTVQNSAGITNTCRASVTVSALAPTLGVVLTSVPIGGVAPLTVSLTASTTGSATGNVDYRFDCTNDGSYEAQSLNNPADVYTAANACTYPTPGIYTARVRVDRSGVTAFDTTSITVTATVVPTLGVTLTAVPPSGNAPLDSTLTANTLGTATGPTRYRFDCTSDGTFEKDIMDVNTFVCNYPVAGFYIAKVVVDREGVSANDTANITVNAVVSGLPDLAPQGFWTTLSTIYEGDTVPLFAKIKNIGTASTPGSFDNWMVIDYDNDQPGTFNGYIAASLPTPVLAVGEEIVVSTTWTAVCPVAAAPCLHRIEVKADSAGVIAESNEGNNVLANWITVNPAPSFNYSLSNSGDITLAPSTSGDVTINVSLVSGVTEWVWLSTSGLPAGASASWLLPSVGQCLPTCSQVIRINSGTAVPGTYPITVTGSPLNRTTSFNLTISAAPLAYINIWRVGPDLFTTSAPPGTTARIVRGAGLGPISTNPANFVTSNPGFGQSVVTSVSGYNVTARQCGHAIGGSCASWGSWFTPTCNASECWFDFNSVSDWVIEHQFRYSPAGPPPTVTLVASPRLIQPGGSSVLTWTSDAVSCSAPWTAKTTPNGFQSVSPPVTTIYTIDCVSGAGVHAQAQATVNVGIIEETKP